MNKPEKLTEEEWKMYLHNQRMRLTDLRNSAVNDMIRVAYRRHYMRKIQEEKPTGSVVLDLAVADVGKECFVRSKDDKNRRWFITIGAKDNVDFHAFYRQMEKCVKKQKLVGHGQYVLEQRSQGDEDPYGWHIHWRVEFDEYVSKSVIVQQVYQCFKLYLAGANYVDVKGWNDNQVSYMEGNKSVDKMPKVEKDRLIRAKYKYPQIVVY